MHRSGHGCPLAAKNELQGRGTGLRSSLAHHHNQVQALDLGSSRLAAMPGRIPTKANMYVRSTRC